MIDFLFLLVLTSFGSLLALIGGVIFLFSEQGSRFLENYSVPFAAGVLLTVALLGILPEAEEMIGQGSFIILLLSFLGAYTFEYLFFSFHHCKKAHHHHKTHPASVPLVIVGDTVHNFVDGVSIAASYLLNPGLGVVTAVATFLHEVPHEVSDFGILLQSGWERKRVLLVNLVSALMTIVGAVLIYFSAPSENLIGSLLAVSAGIFLYLGSSDLLPHVGENSDNSLKMLLPLFLGVVIMSIVLTAIPHS